MQGGDEVVVLLAVLVVGGAALLQHLTEVLDRQRLGRPDVEQGLGQGQQVAAVAVGQRRQRGARVRLQRQNASLERLGLGQQRLQRFIVQPLQHIDLAARQQRPVELERRVLGGGAHQGDDPLLHERQKAVLLRAVEAVDLIDKQQGGLAGQSAHPGLLERLLQVRDAGENGGELLELIARLLGQQARDGGLAGPGRTPQDHRRQAPGLGHASDRPGRPKQMVLAHYLVQPLRAQAVGER